MPLPKLTRLVLKIMERGACSIRELLEAFPRNERLVYTTVQTVVYWLEAKKTIRRKSKFGNADVFDAVVPRDSAQHRMIDDLVAEIVAEVEVKRETVLLIHWAGGRHSELRLKKSETGKHRHCTDLDAIEV
jgi:predicted transcriptional regulator